MEKGRIKVNKELILVKNKIQRLKDKRALIDEKLESLFIREEELENEEIIAICRSNKITIADLMEKLRKERSDGKMQSEEKMQREMIEEKIKENGDEN